jgi:hypothetical protein
MVRYVTTKELASMLETPLEMVESSIDSGYIDPISTEGTVILDLENLPDRVVEMLEERQLEREQAADEEDDLDEVVEVQSAEAADVEEDDEDDLDQDDLDEDGSEEEDEDDR